MQLDANRLISLRAQITALNHTLDDLQRDLRAREPVPPPKPIPFREPAGYRLFGQDFPARNGTETLISAFRQLAELEPRFPERFAQAASRLRRTRAYVGRSPEAVYPGKPELWAATVEFAPGWYLGTNENNATKVKMLRVACRILGLRFGADLRIGL
jgi:hypothetical protein